MSDDDKIVDLKRRREEKELSQPTTITITMSEETALSVWQAKLPLTLNNVKPLTLAYFDQFLKTEFTENSFEHEMGKLLNKFAEHDLLRDLIDTEIE